jgi:hypothetical protein
VLRLGLAHAPVVPVVRARESRYPASMHATRSTTTTTRCRARLSVAGSRAG